MKNQTNKFQALGLEVGERAFNVAGYPKKSKVVVECIKDFDLAPNEDYILENPKEFVRVVEHGLVGLSTSHLINYNWSKN